MKKKSKVIRTINLKLKPKDDVFSYYDDYINYGKKRWINLGCLNRGSFDCCKYWINKKLSK